MTAWPRRILVLVLAQALVTPACTAKPAEPPAEDKKLAALEKTRDALRDRLARARAADPRLAETPAGDVLIGFPVAFASGLVRQVVEGFLDQVELALKDVRVHREDEVTVNSFIGKIKPGAFKLDLTLDEIRALLQPGTPTVDFKGDRLGVALPVTVAAGTGKGTLRLDWDSRGLGAAVCDDFQVTLPVEGRVAPRTYPVKGAFVLRVEGGALEAKPEVQDLVIHLVVEPSDETWKRVDEVIAERSWKCEKVVNAVDLPKLLRGFLAKGFDVRLPATLVKPFRLPAGLQQSVTVEGRTYALDVKPLDLRITPDLLWFGADVEAHPSGAASTPAGAASPASARNRPRSLPQVPAEHAAEAGDPFFDAGRRAVGEVEP